MKYEFTQTLRPMMYKHSAQEQFNITVPLLWEAFRGLKCSCVAELTTENNIHYHAMIELKDHVQRDMFINRLRRYNTKLGRRTVDQIEHEPEYILYMRKDCDETEKIIKTSHVQDDFQILGNLNAKFVQTSSQIVIDPPNRRAKRQRAKPHKLNIQDICLDDPLHLLDQ